MVIVCVVFFIRSLKSTFAFLASYTDPGVNQPPFSDSELYHVVDWDQLSSMPDQNDDTSSPGPLCPFIDWEAKEEDRVDVPASKRNRRHGCFSEGSDTDETVA